MPGRCEQQHWMEVQAILLKLYEKHQLMLVSGNHLFHKAIHETEEELCFCPARPPLSHRFISKLTCLPNQLSACWWVTACLQKKKLQRMLQNYVPVEDAWQAFFFFKVSLRDLPKWTKNFKRSVDEKLFSPHWCTESRTKYQCANMRTDLHCVVFVCNVLFLFREFYPVILVTLLWIMSFLRRCITEFLIICIFCCRSISTIFPILSLPLTAILEVLLSIESLGQN